MDGTLIETEETWDQVRRGLAASQGLAWPAEATAAMMGMSTGEWSGYLVEVVGLPVTPEQAAAQTIAGLQDRYRHGIPVLRGAVEAVRRMARRFPVAIASSSPRVLIEAGIAALDIGDALTASVSTEEVARGKPYPDGFQRACELLGADPSRSVAVEDSSNGIRSALAAGMAVIAIPPTFGRPADELLAKTTVLDSLDDLTQELLASL